MASGAGGGESQPTAQLSYLARVTLRDTEGWGPAAESGRKEGALRGESGVGWGGGMSLPVAQDS